MVNCALNSLDALHLAAACIGKANFLLPATTKF